MIASLTGTVGQLAVGSVVIEVGGFGVLTLCSPNTIAGLRVGETATLATSLVVREDSLTLYGFRTRDERDLFELLQTASGVGPKLAQAALGVLSPAELQTAIATENLTQLCKVPGIGRRGAQRIVLELKDKVLPYGLAASAATGGTAATVPTQPPGAAAAAGWREQVSQGLQGLGWSAREAEAACDQVQPLAVADPEIGVPALLRAALQGLARR